jgi:Signal peptidase, peptidase S26
MAPIRRKRVVVPVATFVAVVGFAAVLVWTGIFVLGRAAGASSTSPTIPACNGGWLGEGLSFRFRDPHRGEIVAIHARGRGGAPVVPDPEARDLNLGKRVIGIPGDSVVAVEGASSSTGGRRTHPDSALRAHASRTRAVLRPR